MLYATLHAVATPPWGGLTPALGLDKEIVVGTLPTHEQLAVMSDEDIISRYNGMSEHTVVGTGFYREELMRRQMARESCRMLALTQTMARLTWVILALTAANAGLVLVQLLKA